MPPHFGRQRLLFVKLWPERDRTAEMAEKHAVEHELERVFAIDGVRLAAPSIAAGLYIVATPIGNLGDVTLRALRTVAAADVIVCEDSRVTRVLLDRYGLSRSVMTYHERNAADQRPKLLAALAEGKSGLGVSIAAKACAAAFHCRRRR